jgi:glycylpeptide N-tetradecanoyltransferase
VTACCGGVRSRWLRTLGVPGGDRVCGLIASHALLSPYALAPAQLLRAVKKPGIAEAIAAAKAGGAPSADGAAATEGTATAAAAAAPAPVASGSMGGVSPVGLEALAKALSAAGVSGKPAAAGAGGGSASGGGGGGGKDEHRFWYTQPIIKPGVEVTEGPIDPPKTVDEIQKTPYALPGGWEWVSIDVRDAKQLTELFELLRDNYVEDTDASFRFRYSPEFLLWALTPPGYFPDWHVGVRNRKTGALEASITGIPANLRVHSAAMRLCEINFLCVAKRLRSKRLAPVLIKEVTRRVNLTGECWEEGGGGWQWYA